MRAFLDRRRIPRALLTGFLACCATGCMVGPDYHKPDPNAPADWIDRSGMPTTRASSTNSSSVDIVAWWSTFRDPTLNRLVHDAVGSNLTLLAAESRIRQARANQGIAASSLFPQLNSTGQYQRSGTGGGATQTFTNPGGGVATRLTGTRSDFWQAGFDSSWEIDVFGGIRRSVEAANAQVDYAIEDKRDVFVSLAAEIAVDYLSLRGYQRQIAITQNNLLSERHTADLTRRKFQAGFVSRLDVANADAQVATTLATLPTLESSAQQTIYALSVLLALHPGVLVEELGTPGAVPPTPPNVPVGLPAELVRRRPDIRRAEANLHAATAEIGVAVSDLFPKFSLSGAFNQEATKFKALGNWTSNVWSIGPTVNWALFTAGRVESNIQVQNELQRQALYTYQQTVLSALQEVESDLIAYAKEQERRLALVDAVKANQQALDLSTRLYQQGQTDFLNVLNAERSLFASQDALAQSDTNVATDLASLYKALAGGWQVTENRGAWPAVTPTTAPAPHPAALPPGVFSTPLPAGTTAPSTKPGTSPATAPVPVPRAGTRPDNENPPAGVTPGASLVVPQETTRPATRPATTNTGS